MAGYILDANLSPKTAEYLTTTLGLDVFSLVTDQMGGLRDEQIVLLAKEQHRVIITLDNDFGEIYYRHERGNIGVILLRLEDESRRVVERVLERFFQQAASKINLEQSLVALTESTVRVVEP